MRPALLLLALALMPPQLGYAQSDGQDESDRAVKSLSTDGHVQVANASTETLSASPSFDFLLTELQEVETMIALQTRKLKLLESVRYRALAGEALDAAAVLQLQSALRNVSSGAPYEASASSPRVANNSEPEWTKHLVNQLQLDLNYSIVASVIMIAKVKRMPGQHGAETLLGLVDDQGYLHVLNENGIEICLFFLEHSALVTTAAFDGTDLKKSIFVTAASDGSVHVMNLELLRNTSLAAEKPLSVHINITFKYKLNEMIAQEILVEGSAPVDAVGAYVTSLLIYVKQSARSFALLIGDSVGRVTLCALYGDSFDTHLIQAGEPIQSMTRLGILVAIAVGHEVHIHVMGRFEHRSKVCRSGGVRAEDKIKHVSMDMGSNPYLFARTADGKILTFDTKARGGNGANGKPDIVCALISTLNPQLEAIASVPRGSGSALALQNMVLVGYNCQTKLYDTSFVKSTSKLKLIDVIGLYDAGSSEGSAYFCQPASSDGNRDANGNNSPRLGVFATSAFLAPKSERARSVDAVVLVTANAVLNWEEAHEECQKDNLACGEECSAESQICPVDSAAPSMRSRLQLFRTVEKTIDHFDNPIGDVFKSFDGWIRAPLFIIAFLVVFWWNGGSSIFHKKKIKKNRYGAVDKDEDNSDQDCVPSPSKNSFSKKSAYSLCDSKASNSRLKDKAVEELKDVTSELERLQRITANLRRQTPLESKHEFED